ncbi:MAG TPA: SagB family peptide dehydrogenase [Xanthobacteraceae bacterium]
MSGPARRSATLSAQLIDGATLDVDERGDVVARIEGYSLRLGRLSAGAAKRARAFPAGLPLTSFASGRGTAKEIALLVRRLAESGLIEYRVARGQQEQAVIEPQVPDYWPHVPKLRDADTLVLSRFAYLRRRGSEMVLESPRAGALFRIGDARIAAALALLATPRQVKWLRRQAGFPDIELLALMVDCRILFKVDARDQGLRATEGDGSLVMWDFHDLLFHARSTEGRHANPVGGVYPHVDAVSELPLVRPAWPGPRIDLRTLLPADAQSIPAAAKLLRERHSVRDFDAARPITLSELSRFLDATARIQSVVQIPLGPEDGGGTAEYTVRPYPAAGAGYELELYLAVDACDGLARGFYHYDASEHALVPIAVSAGDLDTLFQGAQLAMGAAAPPQVVVTIAARFGRVSWKYSSLAYALILKDVGVLLQTLYLIATDIGLGGCAIGSTNIELFAKMTNIEFHVEGAVGQFALGRRAASLESA